MDVALFGLSGDPTHLGHLEVAQHVRRMGYPRVWWMVTPQNPSKGEASESYWHRRELARLLARDYADWLEVTDFEAGVAVHKQQLRTFVVLNHLKERMPEVNFTFVMGADNWADEAWGFHTWENFAEILDLASILILPRDPWTKLMPDCPASRVLAGRRDPQDNGMVSLGCWRLARERVLHPAQSRDIRQELREQGSSEHLTPAQNAYIAAEKLYGVGR